MRCTSGARLFRWWIGVGTRGGPKQPHKRDVAPPFSLLTLAELYRTVIYVFELLARMTVCSLGQEYFSQVVGRGVARY